MKNSKKLLISGLIAVVVVSAVAVIGTSSGDELLGKVNIKRTNLQDLDRDGLTNQEEVYIGTDPMNPNTDGDNLSDSQEITQGCDPLRQDGPGQDENEILLASCPWEGYDYDNDGLYNNGESSCHTSHVNPDTDRDGLADGEEGGVNNCFYLAPGAESHHSDPLDPCDPNPLSSACVQRRVNWR